MRIRQQDNGKFCKLKYDDDDSSMDAILLEEATFEGHWRIFVLASANVDVVDKSQIVAIGGRVRP